MKIVWSICEAFSRVAQRDLAKDGLAQTVSLTARLAAMNTTLEFLEHSLTIENYVINFKLRKNTCIGSKLI